MATIRFEYTSNNEISAIDFDKSKVSFAEFNHFLSTRSTVQPDQQQKQTFSLADARKLLFDYFYEKTFVY